MRKVNGREREGKESIYTGGERKEGTRQTSKHVKRQTCSEEGRVRGIKKKGRKEGDETWKKTGRQSNQQGETDKEKKRAALVR